MPLDKASVVSDLDQSREDIQTYLEDDDGLVEKYQEAFRSLPRDWTTAEVRDELSTSSYPGAVPISSFDDADSIIRHHAPSDEWESHEAVNDWARDLLLDVPMVATDGSEIPPTTQFNVPLAYVQAAWCLNHHRPTGALKRGQNGKLLSPDEITRTGGEEGSDEYRFVDSSLVGLNRYEHEAAVVVDRIETLAEAYEAGELENPPIVLYDGPFVISFANPRRPAIRNRYLEAVSRILAASAYHEIPVIGYVAGTNAVELVKMTRLLLRDDLGGERTIPDGRILTGMMSPWGDSTIPFLCRRDGSVDGLRRPTTGKRTSSGTRFTLAISRSLPVQA
ncbi:DNA double-strand break repair nuclease NurA [Halospeciosus flavus]|uniref:DNA double-strand break repair nuclease NurA n=1 Tax=Halospeciosus flavus TaxID=3032283 RepID=UPI00360AEF61